MARRICVPIVLFLSSVAAADPPLYMLTELDVVPGGLTSYAFAINDSGQVAGFSYAPGGARAVLYDDGTITDLGTLGGSSAVAHGISNAGYVVGYSFTATPGEAHAFFHDGSVMHDLGTLYGTAKGLDVNDSGQVVGYYQYSDSSTALHAFFYDFYGAAEMIDLGYLGTHSVGQSQASSINEAGLVTGYATFDSSQYSHAFLYDANSENPVMQDLGTLPGTNQQSSGYGINELGHVVGQASVVAGIGSRYHMFLYDDTGMHDLGNIGLETTATAVNDVGQVVGYEWWRDWSGWYRAVMYDGNELSYVEDLVVNGDGWIFEKAEDINNLGQIVGWGKNPSGDPRGFLLSPVLIGDLDLDGDVDFFDYIKCSNNFGETEGMGFQDGDMDGDGDVDFFDYIAVSNHFGDTLPAGTGAVSAASVPEPGTVVLLGMGALALAGCVWRKRLR